MLLFKDIEFCRFLFGERMWVEKKREYEEFLQGFSKVEQSKEKYQQALRRHKRILRDYEIMGANPDDSIDILTYTLYKTFIPAIKEKKNLLHAYSWAFATSCFELVRSLARVFFTDRKVVNLPPEKNFDLMFGFPESSFNYDPNDDICDSFANLWMRTNTDNCEIISIDEYKERSYENKQVFDGSQVDRIQTKKSIHIDFMALKFFVPVCISILSFSITRTAHVKFLLDTHHILRLIKRFNAKKSYFLLASYPSGYCQCLIEEREKIVFFSYSVNFFEIPLAWVYEESEVGYGIVTPECWVLSGNIMGNIDPIKRIRMGLTQVEARLCQSNFPDYYSFPVQLGYSSSISFNPIGAQGKPVILVFNARPLEDVVAKQHLLYGHPYLNIKIQIKFITDIIETANTLGYFVVIKNKRVRREKFDSYVKELSNRYQNVFIERERTRMSDLFAVSSASLSFPFGSTKYVGEHFKIPSQYYVPEETRCEGFGRALTGVGELKQWLIEHVNS